MLRISLLACLGIILCQAIFAQQTQTFHKVLPGQRYSKEQAIDLVKEMYNLPKTATLSVITEQREANGQTHIRYQVNYGQQQVDDAIVTAHFKNDLVETLTGFAPSATQLGSISQPSLNSETAFTRSLGYVKAEKYAWQDESWEQRLKIQKRNPDATWKPVAELMYAPIHGNYRKDNYALAYRFDIYSTKPISRQYVYVNAKTGELMFKENRLCEIEVPGTAVTAYSGTQAIMVDSFAGGFRLRETSRGDGIETYNMQTGSDPGNAIDFLDDDNYWDNVNAAEDQYATDAHWGAEMTYDYYYNAHNRNSIDGNGMLIVNYVHEDVDYFNAFWDGDAAHFGDGGSGATPLVCLDIVGHEFTHGVTQFSAGLNYQDESGALNESFSDIFGTVIELTSSPTGGNFLMGEQTGYTIRSMNNPNDYSDPDTYFGTNWSTDGSDNGGVHTNSGVQNYWFYLLVQGGSGTNDLGNTFNVTGLGLTSASAIAYRALNTYLFPSAEYSDARAASIQAAVDLFGPCTAEVAAVSDAWYAVGVGDPYSPTVTSLFNAGITAFCAPPATVLFVNQSFNAGTFVWHFGDGETSTETSPQHVYNDFGTYSVMLIADGGVCGVDTFIAINYIQIDSAFPCISILPESGNMILYQCNGSLYDNGGPTGNYGDDLDSYVTIAPAGATGLVLDFESFNLENNYDYLYLYDGPNTSSTLIGTYTDNDLPNGGNSITTGPVVTVRMTSDVYLNYSGFQLNWECIASEPLADFVADYTTTCSGWVQFHDQSFSSPSSWLWHFGDGTTSTATNPLHFYEQEGFYEVMLVATNAFGVDTVIMPSYIHVDRPDGPAVQNGSNCLGGSVELGATASNSLSVINWYDVLIGGTPIASGETYNTPSLSMTTTYYAEETINYPELSGGLPDNSLDGGYFSNSTDRYLKFDVFTPVKLVSVKVYADGSDDRTIQLRNSNGDVLQDTTVYIPDGENVITLNFDLPIDNQLRLGIGGAANLYRNDGSATYPYEVPGVLSITGSNATPAGYYYYFYDWKLQQPSCISDRVPVIATVGEVNVEFNPEGPINICDGDVATIEALNGDSYLWSNGETTSAITSSSSGTFDVTVTTLDGCSGVGSIDVNVSPSPFANFTSSVTNNVATFTNASTNATTYYWNFGDGSTSTNSNPSHTYNTTGVYTVTLIATNGECSDTFTQTVDIHTGIESVNSTSVQLYPNPASDVAILELDKVYDNATVTITDALGREIFYQVVSKRITTLNTTQFAAGIYTATIRTDDWQMVKKLVKQ